MQTQTLNVAQHYLHEGQHLDPLVGPKFQAFYGRAHTEGRDIGGNWRKLSPCLVWRLGAPEPISLRFIRVYRGAASRCQKSAYHREKIPKRLDLISWGGQG